MDNPKPTSEDSSELITLANLAQATEQEVFNQVKTHLLTQNKKSLIYDSGEICVYRGPDGLQCAAGPLLGEAYTPDFEKKGWTTLIDEGLVPSTKNDALIVALQMIHDETEVYEWVEQLENLARRFNLH